MIVLLPLLGLTWLFGLLAINEDSSAFAWIFIILNSLQVIVCILHLKFHDVHFNRDFLFSIFK